MNGYAGKILRIDLTNKHTIPFQPATTNNGWVVMAWVQPYSSI